MATLVNLHLIIHVLAGILTLITGPIAIFSNNKRTRLHIISGKIFFFAMNYVCISAIIGYFRHTEEVFYVFLLGISILVYANIFRGVRAIQIMKGSKIKKIDFVYTTILGLFAIWMIGMAGYNYILHPSQVAIPILFTVFGIGSLISVKENLQKFLHPENVSKIEWLHFHVSTMLGAFTASTTAFTVNAAHFLPWYIQWFGPTLIILPLQFYWKRQLLGRPQKKTVLT
jgi:uncharacterized membrane protein